MMLQGTAAHPYPWDWGRRLAPQVPSSEPPESPTLGQARSWFLSSRPSFQTGETTASAPGLCQPGPGAMLRSLLRQGRAQIVAARMPGSLVPTLA